MGLKLWSVIKIINKTLNLMHVLTIKLVIINILRTIIAHKIVYIY